MKKAAVAFGCWIVLAGTGSCRTKHVPEQQAPEWKAELQASMEAFKHRKRYPELTPEILEAIPDEELEQAIMDFIDCRVQQTGGREREVFDSLVAGFRAVYSTWYVEAEVGNGGFNQYFWNSSGEFARDAVAGFDLIGAPAMARLMERAIVIRDQDEARTKKLKARGSLEAFSESYQDNRLNDLDREFGELEADLSKIRIRFIRANPDLFRGQCKAG